MSKCSGVPSKVQFKTNTDEGEGAEAISKADRNVSISLRGEFGPLISPANSRSTPSPTGPTTRTLSVSTAIKPGFCRSLSSNPVRGCGEELRDLRSTMGIRTPVRGYRDERQTDDGRPLPRRRNSRSRRHPLSKQSFPYHDLSARCVRPLRSARPSIRAPDGPVKKSSRPSVSPPGGLPTPSYRLPIDRNTYGLSYTVVTRRVRSLSSPPLQSRRGPETRGVCVSRNFGKRRRPPDEKRAGTLVPAQRRRNDRLFSSPGISP